MTEGGKHFDKGKLRLDLITPEMQVAQAAVLTYGAEKYGDNNWERGMPWGKLFGSALRHLWKWWAGERVDPESGLPHLWHAYCNVGFLITYEVRIAGTDDRDERSHYPWSDPLSISEAGESAKDEVLRSPAFEDFEDQSAYADVKRAEEVLRRQTDSECCDETIGEMKEESGIDN